MSAKRDYWFIAVGICLILIVLKQYHGWVLLPIGYGELEKLLAAIAWPLVILVLGVRYRDSLKRVLDRLIKWDSPIGALSFGELLEASPVDTPLAIEQAPPTDIGERLELAKSNPRMAVFDAWITIEEALAEIAEIMKVPLFPIHRFLDYLDGHPLLKDSQDTDVIRYLSRLRNTAVHAGGSEISAAEANQYVLIASMTSKFLLDLKQELLRTK